MKIRLLPKMIAALPMLLLFGTGAALSQSLPPSIFYSDLDSGANSGGENNLGAFVTIYGKSLGSTQGNSFVTVGNGPAAAYRIWTDTKITFQLGAGAQTGGIAVHTTAGASNSVPFTVRAGNIYFVATNGSDSNNGSFSSPWATILKARDTMAPGDTTYVRNGVSQSTDDGNGWNACFSLGGHQGGTAGNPKAIVGYPGETATIGNPNVSGCGYGIRNRDGGESYYTFANLTLRGGSIAAGPGGGTNWRLIGNDMSCPNGNDQAGCLDISYFSYVWVYGNNIHHVATNYSPGSVTALYHGVYLSEQNDHVYFGWNTIAFIQGCRGFQQNINAGDDVFDLHFHDNVVHDTQCDGVLADSMDPSKGPVEFYNNIIYNAGKGPNNAEASGSWSCMNLWGGEAAGGTPGSGVIQVYNNTMYNCGSFATPPYNNSNGGIIWEDQGSTAKYANLRNNIIIPASGQPYLLVNDSQGFLCNSNCPEIRGNNNIFFGSGAPPVNAQLTVSLNLNPLFANASTADFHLTSASPAANGGTTTPDVVDFDGVSLPQGPNYPIGTFALPNGTSSTPTISVAPSSVTLSNGGTASFIATVTGVLGPVINWSLSPTVGSISNSGLYTAPASISAPQTITVTASVLNTNLSASVIINLVPTVSVSVSPPSGSIQASQTFQLTATVSGTINTTVTWAVSSGPGTVSTSGLYAAPSSVSSPQIATVRATSVADPTKFASASITVNPTTQQVSIVISPTTASIQAGQTFAFSDTVSGTTNTAVTWSVSSGPGTVSTSGLYTAPSFVSSPQVATVQVTSAADPTKFASATITVNPVSQVSIVISPTTASIQAGKTFAFSDTVSGTTNTAVTWSVGSGPGTVSASGVYTAPSFVRLTQIATVRVTSVADPTRFASAAITVNAASKSVSVVISPTTASIQAGQTFAFSDTVSGTINTAVTWAVSAGPGTVSASGVYTAPSFVNSPQIATVLVTSVADPTKFASAAITVNPVSHVSIVISPTTASIQAGQTFAFSDAVSGTTNVAVTWAVSSGPGTVSASGLYTAPSFVSSPQIAAVRVTSVADPTKFASASITVNPPTQQVSIAISPTTASVQAGQTFAFSATVSGTTNTAVAWAVVAGPGTVSASGVYSAPSSPGGPQPGATVQVTSVADPTKFASANITITSLTKVGITITPGTANLTVNQNLQFQATVTGTTNTNATWTQISGPGQLSASGLYTAPSSLVVPTIVTLQATSVADPTKSTTATVNLSMSVTNTPLSVTCAAGPNGIQVSWTAPTGRGNDAIVLSSPDAPYWWGMGSVETGGATSGSKIIPLSGSPGLYQCRYLAWDTFNVLALSAVVPVANIAFGILPSSTVVTVGTAVNVNWKAGAGKTSADYIGLYRVGAASDNPTAWQSTNGNASGVQTFVVPSSGAYEFRYVLGAPPTGYTYLTVTKSVPITGQ